MTDANRTLRWPRIALAVMLGATATAAVPQQPPAAPTPAATTPPATPAASPPAATTPPVATPPAKAPAGTPSPTRFEPTDKVRADFDVSFPIDI